MDSAYGRTPPCVGGGDELGLKFCGRRLEDVGEGGKGNKGR